MSTEMETLVNREYQHGWITDIEMDTLPPGLTEDTVRFISARKEEPEWLLEWRLKAFRRWQEMAEPNWPNVKYPPIDYQSIAYYSSPRTQKPLGSLDEVDPKLLATYEKLGIPLSEQKMLAGVAVDAIFDSVSVGTTFKATLAKEVVIFCSFGEAVKEHPELVRKYLGSAVPASDNYFAALNSAVFSDGSFAYIPKGVRCPMELSTYFRINAQETGQFERTLIVAEEGAYVSYLEGCTAPRRDENQLHAAVVELVALEAEGWEIELLESPERVAETVRRASSAIDGIVASISPESVKTLQPPRAISKSASILISSESAMPFDVRSSSGRMSFLNIHMPDCESMMNLK